MPTLTLLALLAPTHATELVVAPFLQDAEPTSVWVVWEDDHDGPGEVRVDDASTGFASDSRATDAGTWLHEARVTGLDADTTYRYHVVSGDLVSEAATLRTPPSDDTPRTLRLVAVSDMQRSAADPDEWGKVVDDGILAWAEDRFGGDVASVFSAVLIPGDLVDNGDQKSDWTHDFFGMAAPLFAQVPSYPVLGNHERDAHWYYDYLHLPDDAPAGLEERVWSKRLGTLELIGLDTNDAGTWVKQLEFLDARLDRACASEGVDFVLVQVHHPYQSELWRPGNNPLTGTLIARLEGFTEQCGKPSLHLFGHTHAYSRGQTRDHAHLMVNVASAGGALDRWGEQAQEDVPAFSVSEDEWGFVVLELASGADPTLKVTRYDMGDEDAQRPSTAIDEVLLRRTGAAPSAPAPLSPFGTSPATCVVLEAGPYAEADGDAHQATHWQVGASCDDFEDPALDLWRQDQNRYFGVDTRAGASLTREDVRDLAPGDWCWRVRYRDASLAWSAWSEPVAFTLTASTRTPPLLRPEEGKTDVGPWQLQSGRVELTGDLRCGARTPAEGAHAVALGGLCSASEPSEVSARVDVSDHAQEVDSGAWVAHLGGWTAGAAVTRTLTFLDGEGAVLGAQVDTVPAAEAWTEAAAEVALPVGTRVLTLAWASESLVELDALSLELGEPGPLDCTAAREVPSPLDTADGVVDEEQASCAGCAAGGAGGGPVGLALAGLLLARRRRG